MVTLQDFLELTNYRITEAGRLEEKYSNLWFYSATVGMMECVAIFKITTHELCEIRLFDYVNAISYDYINPKYANMHKLIDDTDVDRIDMSKNIGEFKDVVSRLLNLK